MEQFGSGTVSRPSGRDQTAPGKNVQDCPALSARVQDRVLPEKPLLKRNRAGLALRFEHCGRLSVHGFAYLSVQFRNGGFLALEMPVRIREVEDRRDESVHDAPSPRKAGESEQVILLTACVHYLHDPHHLAFGEE